VLNQKKNIEQKYRVYNIATFYMPYTGYYGSVNKKIGYTPVTCYSLYDLEVKLLNKCILSIFVYNLFLDRHCNMLYTPQYFHTPTNDCFMK